MSATYRVLISDAMSSRAQEVLSSASNIQCDVRADLNAEELVACIGDYHGLLVRSRTKVTADVIENAHKLQVIGRAGIGVDNIDLAAASRRGIIVENAPNGNAITTAEHAICLLLSLVRHIPHATASMKDNKWEKNTLSGNELFSKTFGIIGLGNIGRIVADRGKGLKMDVIGYDPFMSTEAAARLGVELVELDDLLRRADFVSIHTPLTNDTKGLIGEKQFAMMKSSAFLVNAARGGIVDEEACVRALDAGEIAGAAFDVFTKEPPPPDHPLVMHPKVVTTPHLGASTDEAQVKVAVEVAEQMVDYFASGEVRNSVNVSSLSSELAKPLGPWLHLSKKLGSVMGQLLTHCGRTIDSIEVDVVGDAIVPGATALTNEALVGALSCFADQTVNTVNARVLARERDLAVLERTAETGRDLNASVTIIGKSGDVKTTVEGTLYHIGGKIEPRVVQLDGFLVEVPPTGTWLVVHNEDRPGSIGAIGVLLGEQSINVTNLHVAPEREGLSMSVWVLGGELTSAGLQAVSDLSCVKNASIVRLD